MKTVRQLQQMVSHFPLSFGMYFKFGDKILDIEKIQRDPTKGFFILKEIKSEKEELAAMPDEERILPKPVYKVEAAPKEVAPKTVVTPKVENPS